MKHARLFPIFVRALLLAAPVLAGPALQAETLEQTRDALIGKIESSNAELKALNEEISAGKLPLVQEMNRQEQELLDLRDELRRKERVLSTRETDLATLRRTVERFVEQNDYVSGLLNEFVRNFESRIHIAEVQHYEDATAEAKLALDDENIDATQKMVEQIEVVEVAIERLERILGGDTIEGNALTESGDVATGSFVLYGPSVYFSEGGSGVAGLVQRQLNAAEPVVIPLDEFADGIRALAAGGEGSFAADSTLGKALKLREVQETYFEHIQKGAIVGYAIISLGLLSAVLAVFKFVEVGGVKVPSSTTGRDVAAAVLSGDDAGAKKAIDAVPEPARTMLATGLEHREQARDIVEEKMYETVLAVQPRLERFLPFLAITAAAAPLMGLLGTVIGMIKTFNLITVFGTGDAKSLSSGISEALVTTELGLTIAIPTLVVHGLLSRLAKHKVARLEQVGTAFLNKIK